MLDGQSYHEAGSAIRSSLPRDTPLAAFLYETLKLKDERGWKYWYARQTFGGGFTREPLKKEQTSVINCGPQRQP